ncbi:hypothetical protein EFN30_10840 [Propionibacterium freudenreichii]|nr:hypothetical protein [Propionibacterium freudenreichii]
MCAGVMALSLVAAGCSSTGAPASVPTRSVEELTKDMGNAVNSQASTKSVRITDSGAQKDPTSADATQNFVVEGTMDGSNMLFEQNFSTGYSVSMVLVDDKVYTKANDKYWQLNGDVDGATVAKYADKWVSDDPNTTADNVKNTAPVKVLTTVFTELQADTFQKVDIVKRNGKKVYQMTNDKGSEVDVDPATMYPIRIKLSNHPDTFEFEKWNNAATQVVPPADQTVVYSG